jgi:hypothetical protein
LFELSRGRLGHSNSSGMQAIGRGHFWLGGVIVPSLHD